MPNLVSHPGSAALPPAPFAPFPPFAVAAALLLWLALIAALAARGSFVTPPGEPPLALVTGLAAPLMLFFIGYRASAAFRGRVLSLDIRLISTIQAWRFLGFAFIALYAHGKLPGMFAWPAGLGDMLVAGTAPWIAMTLVRRPSFAASQSFRSWNWLGIADLVIAVSCGTLASGLVPGLVGEVTTAPMASLPLAFVPVYLVPLMLMLHAAALLQSRRAARG